MIVSLASDVASRRETLDACLVRSLSVPSHTGSRCTGFVASRRGRDKALRAVDKTDESRMNLE